MKHVHSYKFIIVKLGSALLVAKHHSNLQTHCDNNVGKFKNLQYILFNQSISILLCVNAQSVQLIFESSARYN